VAPSATTSATTQDAAAGTSTPRGSCPPLRRPWMISGRARSGCRRQPRPPAVAVIAPDASPRAPATIGLDLAGAVRTRTAPARRHQRTDRHREGARRRAIVIEDLDFAARPAPKDGTGGAGPRAGRRGRTSRRAVSGIRPGNSARWSRWPPTPGCRSSSSIPPYLPLGRRALAAALREHHPKATVTTRQPGDRATRARAPGQRRATGNQTAPEEGRATRRGPDTPPRDRTQETRRPRGPRQPPRQTRRPNDHGGNQAAQDRSGPPARQDNILLVQ